jgi:hypothetical protein
MLRCPRCKSPLLYYFAEIICPGCGVEYPRTFNHVESLKPLERDQVYIFCIRCGSTWSEENKRCIGFDSRHNFQQFDHVPRCTKDGRLAGYKSESDSLDQFHHQFE